MHYVDHNNDNKLTSGSKIFTTGRIAEDVFTGVGETGCKIARKSYRILWRRGILGDVSPHQGPGQSPGRVSEGQNIIVGWTCNFQHSFLYDSTIHLFVSLTGNMCCVLCIKQ